MAFVKLVNADGTKTLGVLVEKDEKPGDERPDLLYVFFKDGPSFYNSKLGDKASDYELE